MLFSEYCDLVCGFSNHFILSSLTSLCFQLVINLLFILFYCNFKFNYLILYLDIN